ncbi:Flp pilus assembly protein CpaB [Pelagerythrobacter marinus]|jgi:pilus assembly protein CpaB|uniref:Flp pilus assembly protein CpaB n=1 Tax=Pelagerythrobacter marinus TaxID=538382 RepID=A0ABW9UXL5_9SPHN|nr:Flp pilus assembly protein CpaB [Pelagerythrobacter marinus]MEC9066838.1 Flp pilus assembly protein CpaB [Pseudomonadota bacterium]MXO69198.1 Flp pilus assembly protein CpaB [Pelagerythrobacter marinus]USA39955.1 Flp pilus assembly protein CpaB [Pelagerythrobacter marinus]WPZ05926.1 Flp pilus assembly protein CpaB [Pelagerythrobacter marinus]
MDRKKLVLLLGALVIAIATALAARSMFAGASAPRAEAAQPVPQGPKVLVAQRALPTGTIITADALGFQMWPEELVQDAYFLDGESDITKLLGTVVRHPITAGEPVTQGSLVSPGDSGFLAAALGPGMRAVTVPVSAKTGVAGFVFPGDRVDLVLTQAVKGDDGQSLKASETILRNLRVLATDQSTTQETVDGKTVVRAFRTVTLEVTPKIAEKVAVAQTIGTLSLSLRSIADSQSELERAIAAGDIKVPDDATPEEEEKLLAEAMARPIDQGSTYVTGGDVSRFQRSSMPSTRPSAPTVAAVPRAIGDNRADRAPAPSGPVVRVTRGKDTVEVPVGTK